MRKKKSTRKLSHREESMRFPIAIIYILIILIIISEEMLIGKLFPSLSLKAWSFLGGGFFVLFLLEWIESKIYPRKMKLNAELFFIAFRIIAITLIISADPTGRSSWIGALIIYVLCFYFTPIMVVPLIVLGFVFYYSNPHFTDTGAFVDMSSFIIMFVFGAVIKQDDNHRARNRDLYRELETYAADSALLAKQDERNRISRDLHDTLGHYLVAVNIQLQKAVAYQEIDANESQKALENAQQATSEAIHELRQTLNDLRAIDDQVNFQDQIEQLIKGVEANELPVELTYKGSEEGYPELVLMTLQQAVQEGLTNVQKHARASQVHVEIDFAKKEVQLTLSDDGIGFSRKMVDNSESFGLKGLEERVDIARGVMEIQSKPEKGTTLQITLPKKILS
jgi:signal transduction histidine kinase